MRVVSHQTVKLGLGRHSSPEEGACVMELASMLSGESFTDHPKSVCPVIAEYLRTLNDGCGAAVRDQLYPLAAQVVGSRATTKTRIARRRLCQQRVLELRQTTRSPLERFFLRTGRTFSPATCAAAHLEADRFLDAIAFVDELLALGADEAVVPELAAARPVPARRAGQVQASR